MQGPTTISFEGLDASDLRIAVVATRWNNDITDRLVAGALSCVEAAGGDVSSIDVVRPPGAFELPLTLSRLAESGKYDCLVALGAVIRGETPHFEFVSNEATSGIMKVMLDTKMPIGFGLLTVDTLEQAEARSVEGSANKGWEATATALEMFRLLRAVG